MRSIGMFNAVSVMVGSGEQLVRAMGVIKDVFLAPMQTAIDALEQKIRDIQNRIEDLTEEERRLVPRALKRLFEVQRDLVLTRESLVSLAGTTIRRVNSLIRVISKIGPRTKKVGLKVKLMLRKFDSLLQNSRKILSTAKEDYIRMSTNLNEVRAHLTNFGDSVMKQAKRLEDQMNTWISKTRKKVYIGCAFTIVAAPVCYAIAAPILEGMIDEYRNNIALLKATAGDSSIHALQLADEAKFNVKYIEEELVHIDRWHTRVKEVDDNMGVVFTNELDLLQYIEVEGKAETVDMLCELSKVCTQYMEHKHKYAGT